MSFFVMIHGLIIRENQVTISTLKHFEFSTVITSLLVKFKLDMTCTGNTVIFFSIMIGERRSCVKNIGSTFFFPKPYIIYSCVLNIVIVFFHVTNSLKKLLRQLHRISFMNNNRGSGIPEDANGNSPPPPPVFN